MIKVEKLPSVKGENDGYWCSHCDANIAKMRIYIGVQSIFLCEKCAESLIDALKMED